MARYVFLGPPGAGKGTMAEMMGAAFGVRQISTGDILRAEMKAGTELGRQARQYIDNGQLVPDETVTAIVTARLADPAIAAGGFILDGFPRTVRQAELLDAALERHGLTLDRVVLFEVERELLLTRLTARRVCKACGAVFNTLFNRPRAEGVCDACGGPLIQRTDDSRSTAVERLAVYERQTAPVADYYRRRGLLTALSGAGHKDENFARLRQGLGL
ncbi:MAG: Adenylate kinase [Lentisphaerae bacterium ADurb.BinA184]|nr:MAG: Adenylate kinase [Lentisphaerae bacterium ADurb.BinA184]